MSNGGRFIYLFIYFIVALFTEFAVEQLLSVASSGRKINEWPFGKNVEESGRFKIKIVRENIPGNTEENPEFCQYNRHLQQDLKPKVPEYEVGEPSATRP